MLEEERQLDLEKYPNRYAHVWLGDYARAFEGACFASVLAQARQEGRIGKVSADPILPLRLFWDIGGAEAKGRRAPSSLQQLLEDQPVEWPLG